VICLRCAMTGSLNPEALVTTRMLRRIFNKVILLQMHHEASIL